jgi:hypothetical protein
MSTDNETRLCAAYAAYAGGQVETLVEHFSPDLQWTYLDPLCRTPNRRSAAGGRNFGRTAPPRIIWRRLGARLRHLP